MEMDYVEMDEKTLAKWGRLSVHVGVMLVTSQNTVGQGLMAVCGGAREEI